MAPREVMTRVCALEALADPGSYEFQTGEGDWPFRGFVVRRGDGVWAYRNYCVHAGHPLNWKPHAFLTRDKEHIICASHGALYELDTGLCVAGPCPGKTLKRLAVQIRDGDVWVGVPLPPPYSG